MKGFLMFWWLVFLLHVVLAAPKDLPMTLPGCNNTCGSVGVPYPFGFQSGCFREGFELTCQHNATDGSYKLLSDNFEVLEIMPQTSTVRINNPISWQCYANTSHDRKLIISNSTQELNFTSTRFTISHDNNKFVSVGCNTLALYTMLDYKNDRYRTACVPVCSGPESLMEGSCSGVGCCEAAIPSGFNYYKVSFDETFNTSTIGKYFSRCSYAALMEADNFLFSTTYVTTNDFWTVHNGQVPILMDWSISDGTCEAAQRNKTNYACVGSNSVCMNNKNGHGYTCNCLQGSEGNPYLVNGCQDIDECTEFSDICSAGLICANRQGGYECLCPRGTHRDPTRGGSCYPTGHMSIGITIGIGAGTGATLLILFFAILAIRRRIKVRRNKELKQKFFKQNHGLLLQRLISSTEDTAGRMKIFSLEELEKATNKFDQARILGSGGHGTVYKGILSDLRVVAIKRSKIIKQTEIDQFINEVAILSQINHRNVVKLFGCCLETEVPLLVNEFISNGTLYDHLHVQGTRSLSWRDRLRIALETARAISYLHSAASMSIFHRDIKCSNILLDDCLTAKLSDFGASKSVQIDQTGISTIIQGTFGYLDPEYYHTGRLTEKSDVYSFGVILVELLTREKPYSSSTSLESGSPIARFIQVVTENHLFEILDSQIVEEGPKEQLEEVAALAERCLRMRGEERPGMKEVEVRLEIIWDSTKGFKHPLLPTSQTQSLWEQVGVPYNSKAKGETSRQYSLEEEMLLSTKFGR